MDTINRLAFFTFLAVVFTTYSSHANPDDVVWKNREEEARRIAFQAYNPNPYSITNDFNTHVHKAIDGSIRHSRRSLLARHGNQGVCEATNPIDQCWRCRANWMQNRRRLADCGLGFGRNTTGGKAGEIYVVTDPSDNDMVNPKKGTLRHAVIQEVPLWIIFDHSMVIRLSQELIMTSNKTIDGRGAQVHITGGAGFTIQFIHNVIIHNIRIHDIKVGNGGTIRDSVTHYGTRGRSDGDGISIFGSTNVWIDHVSLSNCADGLIDIIKASTAVTISNCHMVHHNDVFLLGATDSFSDDKIMQVTIAFNHFGKGLIQRMPRIRWGFAHLVNNDYTMWEMYAIGGSQNPTILSQGNRFYGPNDTNAKEITKREYTPENVWKDWVWISQGDIMLNGAFFIQSGDPHYQFKMGDKPVVPRSGQLVGKLTQSAGPLNCVDQQPC